MSNNTKNSLFKHKCNCGLINLPVKFRFHLERILPTFQETHPFKDKSRCVWAMTRILKLHISTPMRLWALLKNSYYDINSEMWQQLSECSYNPAILEARNSIYKNVPHAVDKGRERFLFFSFIF